jgi:ABC-type cobalamin/Fe3+-siderophores transport system ATPase subunit
MLEIKSLSVAYNLHPALRDITLAVRPGEILVVAGPNGAGKSTLIRAVSGVQPSQSGEISIDGNDLDRLTVAQRARYMAVVPQARDIPAAFSVYQTVLLGRTPYLGWMGQANSHDHACVKKALLQADALEFADRRVGELSGGEQQRVLLARALAQETPVLLLDEPTTHLDLKNQSRLLNLIQELVHEKSLAVLMVLHDLNLAGLYGDRIALLIDGRLEALGSPEEVLTEEELTRVYDIPVHIIPHPDYGSPLVLPDGRGGI